jgi:Protein of unknown function (DUF2934)
MAVKKPSPGKKRSPRKSTAKQASNTGVNQGLEVIPENLRAGIQEEIRLRAYELYVARGRQEGFDREDWTQAEAEVLARRQKEGA